MVILHHCIDNYISIAEGGKLFSLLIVFLHTCHVPVFLIVAGYFCHKQPIKQFYQKKIKQLLIPFVVFSLLKLIYSSFVSSEFSHGGESVTSQIAYSFLIGRQYWFIYTIFIIFLFAPLLWIRSEEKQSFSVAALIISYLIASFFAVAEILWGIVLPEYFQIDHVIYYFPYFVFGYYIKQNKDFSYWLYSNHKKGTYLVSGLIIFLFMLTYTVYRQIRIHSVRFFVAVSFFNILYLSVNTIRRNSIMLNSISRYSLQIMFLDGFYRVIMFAGFKRIGFINSAMIIIITSLVLLLSVLTCIFLEKTVYIKKLIGL